MASEHPEQVRHEHTEVVATPSAQPVASTEHVEAVVTDPYAPRRATVSKVRQAIYLLFGLIEALVAIRFALRLLGANPAADFAAFIYAITAPLVAPFVGLFGTPQFNGSVLEPHSLVAIIVYALLAWLMAKLVWIVWGETRTGVTTSSRSVDTHSR